MESEILIRPIQAHPEYRAVERLQREVWGLQEVEIVPDHLLITVQKDGGLVLGAFETSPKGEERLVGFVFGFLGRTPEGRLKHCSHMAGVIPGLRDRNIGYRLKCAQREHVLAQGIDLITWTFDPLESRNAHLNFHKLGVVCRTYLRDLYGPMRDALNVGLPSDRFHVEWPIDSPRVAERLRRGGSGLSLSGLLAQGAPILNPARPGDPVRPAERTLPLEEDRVLVEIPAHFQAIRAADLSLARAWRLHTRSLFEAAFARGYTVVDHLFQGGRSCYLLERE
ncbi:MAG TPA: hypothetical protein EYH27_07465 [Anaerolineales bacterium]|nr:hypothetical protein [Anaerolineales bacterium]